MLDNVKMDITMMKRSIHDIMTIVGASGCSKSKVKIVKPLVHIDVRDAKVFKKTL